MANENHASYAKVGLTVLVGIVAVVATLVYIGGVKDSSDEMLVETFYDKPVSGLSVGSAVNFRGVKIGEVRAIDLIGNVYKVKGPDNLRIYILMALNRRVLGAEDDEEVNRNLSFLIDKLGLRATVTASGITGMSRMEFDLNRDNPPPRPEISWTPRARYVPPKISLLDNFSDSATRVMNQINKMDLNVVWSNINATVHALAQSAEGMRVMIESRQGDVERIVEDIAATAASVKELTGELRRNPSLLLRDRVAEPLAETAR